jgi:hypothetical protein
LQAGGRVCVQPRARRFFACCRRRAREPPCVPRPLSSATALIC